MHLLEDDNVSNNCVQLVAFIKCTSDDGFWSLTMTFGGDSLNHDRINSVPSSFTKT